MGVGEWAATFRVDWPDWRSRARLDTADGNAMADTDKDLIDGFLARSSAAIEELVTRALHRGRRPGEIVLVLERGFDGSVTAKCGMRDEVAKALASDPRLPQAGRAAVVEGVVGAAIDEVPVVVFAQAEGYTAAGVRRLKGAGGAVA